MNYIFDLDDTLLFSEKIKKETYFGYLLSLYKSGKLSTNEVMTAMKTAQNVLFKKGEKDVFDTAGQVISSVNQDISESELRTASVEYVAEQMSLLRKNYQNRTAEVIGATLCLGYLAKTGAILGVNTGNQVSFARKAVRDRNWPIPDNLVFGAGDTPDDNPYSLEMKVENIRKFAAEIMKANPGKYKTEAAAMADITMVGDGAFDYQSAKIAGCHFIGLKPHNDKPSKLDKYPDAKCFDNMLELWLHIQNKRNKYLLPLAVSNSRTMV